MIKFNATKYEEGLIALLAKRAERLGTKNSITGTCMDLTAVHSNGCPLNFDLLCTFRDSAFMHDINGIRNCLDRDTGKLTRNFHPKCARKEPS